jgi:hypothetical protein
MSELSKANEHLQKYLNWETEGPKHHSRYNRTVSEKQLQEEKTKGLVMYRNKVRALTAEIQEDAARLKQLTG